MNLLLLAPLGLVALAGLLVPLVLHLRRRTQFTTVAFSALRWLETSERPRQRPRLERWVLLLLRLLLLAALALWLARPAWLGGRDGGHWVVRWPGAGLPAGAEATAPRQHWLAPGFPLVDPARGPAPALPPGVSASSLLRQLDAELPADAKLTVRVPPALDGLDAAALQLAHAAEWEVVEPGVAPPPAAASAVVPVQLEVALPSADHPARRWLVALLAGWQVARPDGQLQAHWREPGTALPSDAARRWLAVDVATAEPPAGLRPWLQRGGRALAVPAQPLSRAAGDVVWRAADGRPLAWQQTVGQGQWVLLARPLDPRVWPELLDPAIASALWQLFDPRPAPARALAAAVQPGPAERVASVPQPQSLDAWFALGIAFLFLLERLLAGFAPRTPAAVAEGVR